MLATEHLERQGFAAYCPRLALTARRRGRIAQVIRPLFPRYLFLGFEPGVQSVAPVVYTRGVSNFVKFGPVFAVVPPKVVQELRRCADPETGLHPLKIARFFAGSRVRVVGGAFEGLQGVFQRESGGQQVIVLLDLLGQSARVCLAANDIVADEETSMAAIAC
jgi:transcriptional antiterminator RfaH